AAGRRHVAHRRGGHPDPGPRRRSASARPRHGVRVRHGRRDERAVGARAARGVTMDKPRPRPTATSAPFWDALRVGELRLQRCDACGTWIHYPRNRCPRCLSADISWHTVEPRGTVYTCTVAVAPTAPM